MAKKATKQNTVQETKVTQPGQGVQPQDTAGPPPAVVAQTEPMSDEELESLIVRQNQLLEQLGSNRLVAYYCLPSIELIDGLLSRNFRNRYKDWGLVNKYANSMLTNLKDEHGQPIKGTTEWIGHYQNGLSVDVMLDSEGCNHNAQHCMEAYKVAIGKLRSSEAEKKLSKGQNPSITDLTGITEEMLQQNFLMLVKSGFAPEAADYIDAGRSRTIVDVLYRHGLFDDVAFSGKVKDDATKAKRIAAMRQRLSNVLASTAKFSTWRYFWGKLPRESKGDGSSKFERSEALNAIDIFPGIVESVVAVDAIKRDTGKAFTGTPKNAKVEIGQTINRPLGSFMPYLTTTHYFAKMSDAVHDTDGSWIESSTGATMADQFIRLFIARSLATPLAVQGITQYNPAFDAIAQGVRSVEDASGDELNNRLKSLAILWRIFRFGETYDVSMAIDNPPYVLFGNVDGFDHILPSPRSSQSAVQTAAIAHPVPTMGKPSALGLGAARPSLKK